MPASMISAPTGGRPKVIGSSIAIVATVPMPGKTPTSVPTSAPIRQNTTFIGIGMENPRNWYQTNVKTTPKPCARFPRSSDMTTSTQLRQRGRGHPINGRSTTDCLLKQREYALGEVSELIE